MKNKIQWFPLSMLVFGQKSRFSGPSQAVLQKVNIHKGTWGQAFNLFVHLHNKVLTLQEVHVLVKDPLMFLIKHHKPQENYIRKVFFQYQIKDINLN